MAEFRANTMSSIRTYESFWLFYLFRKRLYEYLLKVVIFLPKVVRYSTNSNTNAIANNVQLKCLKCFESDGLGFRAKLPNLIL